MHTTDITNISNITNIYTIRKSIKICQRATILKNSSKGSKRRQVNLGVLTQKGQRRLTGLVTKHSKLSKKAWMSLQEQFALRRPWLTSWELGEFPKVQSSTRGVTFIINNYFSFTYKIVLISCYYLNTRPICVVLLIWIGERS